MSMSHVPGAISASEVSSSRNAEETRSERESLIHRASGYARGNVTVARAARVNANGTLRTSVVDAALVKTICPPALNDVAPVCDAALSMVIVTDTSDDPPAGIVTLAGESVTFSPVATTDFTLYVPDCAAR